MKRRTTKPKGFWIGRDHFGKGSVYIAGDDFYISLSVKALLPKEARKLAAWLIRAADYLESKEKK